MMVWKSTLSSNFDQISLTYSSKLSKHKNYRREEHSNHENVDKEHFEVSQASNFIPNCWMDADEYANDDMITFASTLTWFIATGVTWDSRDAHFTYFHFKILSLIELQKIKGLKISEK